MTKSLLTFFVSGFLLIASVSYAATKNVSNSTQLNSALSTAVAGDIIVLADGNYAGFTATKSGTSSAKITIKAANMGKAVINSGTIRLQKVSYVVLQGLKITTPGSSKTIDGESFKVAVWFEATQNCQLTRCSIKLSGHSATTDWVMLSGNSNNNQIDHNDFGSNSVKGHFIFVRGNRTGISVPSDRTSWANGNGPNNPNMARNTRIYRNYFHDQSTGTGAALCLGGIGLAGDYQATYTTVEYNLLTNCNGDPEMIETKSSNNTIRYNTIRTCNGMISLRAGNNSTVDHNIMLQGGKAGTAGIKIYEKNHKVTYNYVDNCTDYPYLIGAGDAYNGGSFAHAACVNCKMDYNIGVNINSRGAIIGHGGSGVNPSGCSFSYNQLRGSASPLIVLSHPGNTVMVGNTTSGSNPAIPSTPLTTADVGPSTTKAADVEEDVTASAEKADFQLVVKPNPVVNNAEICYNLSFKSDVKLSIVDLSGKEIKVIEEKPLDAGSYCNSIDVTDLATGVYLICLKTQSEIKITKMMVEK